MSRLRALSLGLVGAVIALGGAAGTAGLAHATTPGTQRDQAAAASGPLDAVAGSLTVTESAPGGPGVPVPVGLRERLRVRPVASLNAEPLTGVALVLPQISADPGAFPTCSVSRIDAAHTDAGCPSGALVARGILTGALWSPASPTLPGQACFGDLDVWNAGSGRLAVFVSLPAGYWCDDLQTGAIPAWTAHLGEEGHTLLILLPLPPMISTNTAATGLFTAEASLELDFPKLAATRRHQEVGFLNSTGCRRGRRAVRVGIDATNGLILQRSSFLESARC